MSSAAEESSETNFLAESNHCGQSLLRLVAHGNAIVSELLRISKHIPSVFLPFDDPSMQGYLQSEFPFANKSDYQRYMPVVFDFKYLKNPDSFDAKISSNADLLDLDEEFRENFIPILDRFYLLFESVFKYYKDYVQFLQDLEAGTKFIQQTFESVLVNRDGKQLLVEAIYLYGCMLIIMDIKIPGPIRERMLVSYYRYKGTETDSKNIIPVCNLFRATGFIPFQLPGKKGIVPPPPQTYPIDYLNRLTLPQQVVSMIIGRLRSDDIYLQSTYYPLPEHRSTALANQAQMLYIILYFKPNLLNKEQAVMREIVDKHFPDNWVISYYMGFTVDLGSAWSQFKAADLAIKNTVQLASVKDLAQMHMGNVHDLIKQLQDFLTEGVLTEEYVLDHINKLLSCLRACNVTLRWLMLHRTADDKKVKEIILKETNPEDILLLLLNTSQLEFVLKEMFIDLLAKKQEKWGSCRATVTQRMQELSEYFSGEKALQRVRDEQLQAWFKDLSGKVEQLEYHDSTLAGRKINQLIAALEDVQGFHQIESSLQVKQFINDSIELLRKMIRYVNIKESILVTISTISDVSYAWHIIRDYVDSMQKRIKQDPSLIIKMRSSFLKLASLLELPLIRIQQAQSKDLVSVSSYYSNEIVSFVRTTLDIIPISMFGTLNVIIDLQTNSLKQLPTRLPRDQLKEYAQLDQRYALAKATHEVSKFTDGILAMKKTLMGIIEVDPKQLLEDGIRKELVRQIATLLDTHLVFKTGKISDFEEQLRQLKAKLEGMLLSFEYIQDYVNIYGNKIWQEEFSRIVHYNVEQECNKFLKRKIFDWQSQYQSTVTPIPKFKALDDNNVNFMGRLVEELLNQTDHRRTTYYDQLGGWFDIAGNEVIGITTFSLLKESVGVFGVTGIDTLISHMNVKMLQQFNKRYNDEVNNNAPMQKVLQQMKESISPASSLPQGLAKLYPTAILTKFAKLFPLFLDISIRLGRSQLIRKHIANELNFSCKLDANALASALDVINKALINDIRAHLRNPLERPHPNNTLLPELTTYLETAGMANPLEKVYIATPAPLNEIGLLLCFLVVATLPRFYYDETIDCLICRKKDDNLDAIPFVVGVITLLRQAHISQMEDFLAYLGQYVRACIDGLNLEKAKNPELPMEVTLVLRFLHIFCKWANMDFVHFERVLHPFLFSRWSQMSGKPSK